MPEPEDQHQIVFTEGVRPGQSYAAVIGLHGQPRRGQAPREYAFAGTVLRTTRELVSEGRLAPLVLVLPVFRFEGTNWPGFELAEFISEVQRLLSEQRISVQGWFVFGHSGAAGCGGAGLNTAATAPLAGVGFFDTCLGAGFLNAVQALARKQVPSLIVHSVETAGFRPRQRQEYLADFDFGGVYAKAGLHPSPCPSRLPDAPLRDQTYRCATSDGGTTQALVLDTGTGEAAHQALLPLALRYFLLQYLTLPGSETDRSARGAEVHPR